MALDPNSTAEVTQKGLFQWITSMFSGFQDGDYAVWDRTGGLKRGRALADGRSSNQGSAQSFLPDLSQLVVPDVGSTLTIPTGYTGNDIVEPSVLYDSSAPFFADATGQNGYEYAICVAGYYQSNAIYENPNLWVSHDGTTWTYVVFTNGIGLPTANYGGVLTPIVPNASQGDGNLSDPYLCRGPDGTYYIIYNQFLNATGSGGTGTGGNTWATKVIKATSLAGPWSTPATVIAQKLATRRDSCPTAVWDGSKWQIYAIDLHDVTVQPPITYWTASQLDSTWTVGTSPTISVPSTYSTQGWWHLNAYRWGSRLILLIQDNVINSSTSGNLWVVWSDDLGTTWTVPSNPFLKGSYYRSCAVFTQRARTPGLDLYAAVSSPNWLLYRATATFEPLMYAGLGSDGVPNHAKALAAAKAPVTPFTVGDTANRGDSATLIGTLDSGQTFTVVAGTWGISSKQIYVAVNSGNNNKVNLALTGNADGVFGCEFSAIDTSIQQFFLVRYTDASNFVRIGYATTGAYKIENIVSSSISQAQLFATGLHPTAGDILTIVCNGSTIDCYVNGLKQQRVTGWTDNQFATGIGLQANNTGNNRWRNIYARTLINGS